VSLALRVPAPAPAAGQPRILALQPALSEANEATADGGLASIGN
jgi:hypothetical protein